MRERLAWNLAAQRHQILWVEPCGRPGEPSDRRNFARDPNSEGAPKTSGPRRTRESSSAHCQSTFGRRPTCSRSCLINGVAAQTPATVSRFAPSRSVSPLNTLRRCAVPSTPPSVPVLSLQDPPHPPAVKCRHATDHPHRKVPSYRGLGFRCQGSILPIDAEQTGSSDHVPLPSSQGGIDGCGGDLLRPVQVGCLAPRLLQDPPRGTGRPQSPCPTQAAWKPSLIHERYPKAQQPRSSSSLSVGLSSDRMERALMQGHIAS